MKAEEIKVEYWHHSDDPGLLSCQTLDEAIEDFIECETMPEEPLPEKKIFYGYAAPKAKLAGVLEWVLECLDDEYCVDDENTEPTDEITRFGAARLLRRLKWTSEGMRRAATRSGRWRNERGNGTLRYDRNRIGNPASGTHRATAGLTHSRWTC